MPNPLDKHPLQSLNGAQPQTEPQMEAFLEGMVSSWMKEAKAKPPITPLFDAFWGKGELTFLFGSTGIGKSILAFQIADAISKGAKVQGFDGVQTPMKVGYFDFELSDIQLLKRYSDERGNVHQFSDIFWRFEMNPNLSIPKGMNSEDFILSEIEKKIIKHRFEVVIIDNLTALLSNITETKDARDFMRKLLLIKSRRKISMLVIGHTPKRDISRPLTRNDMQGSMQLLNLCDSAFAIGESVKECNVRYVKQIKARSAEFKYDSENVAIFKVVKNGCYLCFEHIGFDSEREHLRERTDAEMNELEMNIHALHQSEPNLSYAEIARRLNTNKSKVSRALKKLNK
jgi:RecA-family ATPase